MKKRHSIVLGALVSMMMASYANPGSGQTRAPRCTEEEEVGSLGITGIRCERCSFYTNGTTHRAVFYTEPMIQTLNAELPAADVLDVGDVLVAIEGKLITTSDGSALFSSLPPRGEVAIDVRREGRLRRLRVPLGPTCPVAPDERSVDVEGRPAPVRPPLLEGRTVHVDQGLPFAGLGFDLTCVECRFDTLESRWFFDEYPQIGRIRPGTVAGDEWNVPWGGRLIALDGADLTTLEGGRRFTEIQPGDRLRWTVHRFGREFEATTVALPKEDDLTARQVPLTGDPTSDAMRLAYSGDVGPAWVEVRYDEEEGLGGGMVIKPGRDENEVVIRIGGREIRIRVEDPSGRAR